MSCKICAESQLRKIELRLRLREQQLRGDLLLHTRDKIRRRFQIERNHNDAAQQTTVEARDPLRPVLTPEEHPIASDDFSLFKLTRELKRTRSQSGIRPARNPHARLISHGS